MQGQKENSLRWVQDLGELKMPSVCGTVTMLFLITCQKNKTKRKYKSVLFPACYRMFINISHWFTVITSDTCSVPTNGQSYPFQQYYPTPYKYHIYKSIFNLKRLLGILLQITEPSSICHIGISKDWQTFMYSLQTLLPKLSLLSFSQCHHLQVHIMAGLTISYINNVGLKKINKWKMLTADSFILR